MAKQTAITTHSLQVRGDWYHVRRRGSRYNIFGPDGRAFPTYQSAGVAGPRWEELTGTLWPHPSSAYRPGLRLAQIAPTPSAASQPAPAPPAQRPPLRYDIIKIRRVPLAEPVQERLQDPTIRALLARESNGSGPDARRARQALEAAAVAVDDAAFEVRCGATFIAGPYATLLIARAVKVTLIERDRALLSDPAAALPLGLPAPRAAAEAPPPEPEAEREPARAPRLDREARLRRNQQRNAQRAARIDAQAVLTQHVAWQAAQLSAAKSSKKQLETAKSS